MATVDNASESEPVTSGVLVVDEERVDRLIRDAGYVHPLFVDPHGPAAAGFDARPVPGQLVLSLLAGLAEQADLVDESVIALVGMDDIRFRRPVAVGSRLRLVSEKVDTRVRKGRRFVTYHWTGEVDGDTAVEADVTFLCR